MAWSGMVTAVQPCIRVTRSFDQRSHTYLGYLLLIEGVVGGERGQFRIAIGSGAHRTHQFRVGDQIAEAGGNVSIVTSFEFQVHPGGTVLAGLALHPASYGRDVHATG